MTRLDELIRKAKPSVPELSESFSVRVMSELSRSKAEGLPGKANLRQRRLWMALGGAFLLVIGLALVNQSIFEVQSNGSLELYSYGGRYILDAVQYIPFDLLLTTLIVISLASWMIWRSNTIKKGIAVVLAGSILFSGFGGAAMAATDLNVRIKDKVINGWEEMPWISHFYRDRARYCVDHPNFRMGKVKEISGNRIVIVDPNGRSLKLAVPDTMNTWKGQVISVTGERNNDVFVVRQGRHCDMGRVDKYFGHMSMMNMPMMRHHMRGGGMMRR